MHKYLEIKSMHSLSFWAIMKTSLKTLAGRNPALAQWSAFGASALAGLTAGMLWAPAAGPQARARLAAGVRDWLRSMAGRWNLWAPVPLARRGRHHIVPTPQRPASDLAMQPNRLLTED